MSFRAKLTARWHQADTMLCVGLDPDPLRLPPTGKTGNAAIEAFCLAIVDATADLVCAFKPQIAYFAALGAEAELERIIGYIHTHHPEVPVILDAKRGDIGATAQRYASEAFERFNADAVTLSPYMGSDSIEPWLRWSDRGLFILCRTSNPGGDDLQALAFARSSGSAEQKVFQRVADLATQHWNPHGQTGLVVGATYPHELALVRSICPDMPLLVPGIGAQGGDLAAAVNAGRNEAGYGLVINSSRAILYAGQCERFADASREIALATRDAIRAQAGTVGDT